MGATQQQLASVIAGAYVPWNEGDALFAWSPFTDSDTTQVAPTLGAALAKTSAAAATGPSGSGLWDMTGGVYANTSGMSANVDTTKPFMIAVTIDKNTQSVGFATLIEFSSASNIWIDTGASTGSTAPRWKYTLNSGAFSETLTCPNYPAAGTPGVFWTFCDPVNGTISYGMNQTVAATLTGLTVPSNGMTRNVTIGAAFNSTSNVSHVKQGLTQIVANRSGISALTLAKTLSIVRRMQNAYGI